MKIKIFAIFLNLFLLSKECLSDDRTPFCDYCTCVNQTLTNPDVDCSFKIISSSLYKEEMWFNKEKNATFNIASLNLQNIDLELVNEAFPKSGLKKLDLSNNRIRNISNDVFANLEDMEELILSNNRLQVFSPEIFRVCFYTNSLCRNSIVLEDATYLFIYCTFHTCENNLRNFIESFTCVMLTRRSKFFFR